VPECGRRAGDTDAPADDAKVFEKYSQMNLQMKREALTQLNRQAGDSPNSKES
jgi:hypothetical protein